MNFLERERRLTIYLRDHTVLLLQDVRKFGAKGIDVEQIGHADADTCMFIDVGRPDTTLCAINFVRSSRLLLKSIQQKMVGHDNMRPFADIEVRNIDAKMLEFVHLGDKTFWINDDTIANNAGGVWVENAGWDKTKGEFALIIHDPVSCVASSLVAHDILCVHR